jgi:hypothetical protein
MARKEEFDEEEESHNGSSTTTPGNRFGLVSNIFSLKKPIKNILFPL